LPLAGCGITWEEIEEYAQIGISAVDAVLKILVANGVITAQQDASFEAEIQALFTDVKNTVNDYMNAPASDKNTTAGKVLTALQAVANRLGAFWNDLSIPNAQVAATISALLIVVISTLRGFMEWVRSNTKPQLAAMAMPMASARVSSVPPKQRTNSQFKKDFNATLKANGLSSYALK
jgi:hypothetical protein